MGESYLSYLFFLFYLHVQGGLFVKLFAGVQGKNVGMNDPFDDQMLMYTHMHGFYDFDAIFAALAVVRSKTQVLAFSLECYQHISIKYHWSYVFLCNNA